MSAADALILRSHPPKGSLAAPGDGAGDDGDDPSPRKPSHTVEDADPIFPEEDEEEEEEDDDGDGENPSPQPPQPCAGTTRNRLQPQTVPEGRPEFCSVCNKMFRSIKALHGHMRSHPLRNWRGTVPPQVKGAENEVADYLLLLSGQEPEQRKRKFICSSCNREFPTRQALGGHRASHKGQKGCYEKAKEAREYGPRLGRKRALNEMETAGAAPSEAKQTELVVVQYFASSSQPQVTTPSPPAALAPAPAAALPSTPPPAPAAAAVASAATKWPAKGAPRVATRRRRLLDLNMAPVSSEEDNSGGNGDGSSTSSGKVEDSKMDSSCEASKP